MTQTFDIDRVEAAFGYPPWSDAKGRPHIAPPGHAALDFDITGATAQVQLSLITSDDGLPGVPTTSRYGPVRQRIERRSLTVTTDEAVELGLQLNAYHGSRESLATAPYGAWRYLRAVVLGEDAGEEPDAIARYRAKLAEGAYPAGEWATQDVALAFAYGPLLRAEPTSRLREIGQGPPTWHDLMVNTARYLAARALDHASARGAVPAAVIAEMVNQMAVPASVQDVGPEECPVELERVARVFDPDTWPAEPHELPLAQLHAIAMLAVMAWFSRHGRAAPAEVAVDAVAETSGRRPERVPGGWAFRFGCGEIIVEPERDLAVGLMRTIDDIGTFATGACALRQEILELAAWAMAARDHPIAARSVWLHALLLEIVQSPFADPADHTERLLDEFARMLRKPSAEDTLLALLERIPRTALGLAPDWLETLTAPRRRRPWWRRSRADSAG